MALSRIANMKKTLVKALVLLFSIAAVSCFVWNASQRNKGAAADAAKPVNTAAEKKPTVTDAEVKAARETMLRSSKSGRIMSEEDTRKMLEERLEQKKTPAPKAEDLAPSSKVMRIVSPDGLKELTREEAEEWLEAAEGPLNQTNQNAPKAEDLAPSSKVMRIVSPDEIKQVQKKLESSQQPEAEQPIQKESR
jgi:hypothetical protein